MLSICVILLSVGIRMMDTTMIKEYTSNPKLNTIIKDSSWKGTPVDKIGRFMNLNHPFKPDFGDVLRWQMQTNPFKKEKKTDRWKPDPITDTAWIHNNEDVIVWLGHTTFFIRMNGVTILTDPVFGNILTVKRTCPFPVDPDKLPKIDYVLLSHDHRDHLDKKSLLIVSKNNPDAIYLSGLGSEKLIHQYTLSKHIETAGWYQQYTTDTSKIAITFIPSRHWSKRGAFDDNKRLWGGFVLEAKGKRILFGGDSGYDTHYTQLAEVFGNFDYALLGIGAYEPVWFMSANHQSPTEALQAFKELNATWLIPMHYGTFDLSDEPVGLPIKELIKEADTTGQLKNIIRSNVIYIHK